jgi:hypothetical protein
MHNERFFNHFLRVRLANGCIAQFSLSPRSCVSYCQQEPMAKRRFNMPSVPKFPRRTCRREVEEDPDSG